MLKENKTWINLLYMVCVGVFGRGQKSVHKSKIRCRLITGRKSKIPLCLGGGGGGNSPMYFIWLCICMFIICGRRSVREISDSWRGLKTGAIVIISVRVCVEGGGGVLLGRGWVVKINGGCVVGCACVELSWKW